ncbi:hypothetical protein NL676_024180 [Syzygium grande]|nr:hypothetical protein NL676_024180 [Syzygium grande]
MAKNRNKKKRNAAVAMDVAEQTVFDGPQAMDTSESGAKSSAAGAANRNIRKGRPMKRTKNVRKMKAMAKAVSKNEQTLEKASKNDSKTVRTQSAKTLYD